MYVLPAPSPTAASNHVVCVTDSSRNAIMGFNVTTGGNESPSLYIGDETGLDSPQGVAVDTVNQEIWVAEEGNNSLSVYSRTGLGIFSPCG